MTVEAATYIAEMTITNPAGTDLKSEGDNHIRLLKAAIKNTFPNATKPTYIQQPFDTVASASTVDLGAQTTDHVTISGTTTIVGFGTVAAGVRKTVTFSGALTLTYNASSLILPGDANILTVAGDCLEAISLGSGNWLVTEYHRQTGKALIPPAIADISTLATTLALLAAATPIGHMVDYGGTTAPNGWIFAYGQAISRTTYSGLFAVYDVTWGSGDGSTTFNVPDARGRVVAGQDDMGGSSANRLTGLSGGVNGDTLAAVGGAESHSMTEAQNGQHFHYEFVPGESNGGNLSSSPEATPGSRGDIGSSTDYDMRPLAGTINAGRSSTSGSGTAHNNVQPTIIMNKIIWTGVVS